MTIDLSAEEMLRQSLADLSTAELAVTVRWAYRYATGIAERDRPRLAAVAHAVGVLLAEESDRRTELLEALDPDAEEVGGIVEAAADEIATAREELRRAAEGEAAP